jgi:YidC/Oxa1 family membrane protein insertase
MQPQNQDMNKRLILASALMFLVFIGWGYLTPDTQPVSNSNKTTTQANNSVGSNNVAPSTTTVSNSTNKPLAPNSKNSKIIATVESENFLLKLDELGRVDTFILRGDSYVDEANVHINLIDPQSIKPLEIRFADKDLNDKSFAVEYKSNIDKLVVGNEPKSIILTQNLDNLLVTKNITFYNDGHYDIDVKMSKKKEYFITPGFRPSVEINVYTIFQGTLLKQADDTIELIEDGDLEKNRDFVNSNILSAVDRYYTTLFYDFDKTFQGTITPYKDDSSLIFTKFNGDANFHGFIGPKDYRKLSKIDDRLTEVIEYGFFTFVAKPLFLLLNYIYGLVGNWGWSIVLITIFIRLVLYPLTYKGMLSMNKIKELAPKIKELQAKHKDNKQKASVAMMELYKKNNANPMGGCLPLIMQIPVFFAIYRVLMNAIELKGAPWILWISDLSLKDPYYVLPLLMGATMYIQQVITPNTLQDPLQQKIFKFLPLVFIVFFITFPAGLTLYWFINNVLSVAQQYYINRLFEKKKMPIK